jgi:hypothetical protein
MTVALSCSLAACDRGSSSEPADRAIFSHERYRPVVLTGEPIVDSPALGLITGMIAIGGSIVAHTRDLQPVVMAIDLVEPYTISTGGRHGSGPGEFMSFSSLSIRGNHIGEMWGYDYRTGTMTEFAVARPPGGPLEQRRQLRLDTESKMAQAVWLGTTRILGTSLVGPERFILFDTLGKKVKGVDAPLLGADSIAMEERFYATIQSMLCPQVSEPHHFAVLHVMDSRIDVYDSAGMIMEHGEAPNVFDAPFLRVASGVTRFAPSSPAARSAYLACAATRGRFYALFEGALARAVPRERRGYAAYIHVFGWSGRLEKVFEISPPVSTIAVDADGELLYGFAEDGVIYKYRVRS